MSSKILNATEPTIVGHKLDPKYLVTREKSKDANGNEQYRFVGVVQKQPFLGYPVEQKPPAQAGGMIVRNSSKTAAL